MGSSASSCEPIGDGTVVTCRQTPSHRPSRYRPSLGQLSSPAYEGKWVALVGDVVAASADTSGNLAVALDQLDPGERERAVVQFVRPTSDSFIVGAG